MTQLLNLDYRKLVKNERIRHVLVNYVFWAFAIVFFIYAYTAHKNDSDALGIEFSSKSGFYAILAILYTPVLVYAYFKRDLEIVPMAGKQFEPLVWISLIVSLLIIVIQAVTSFFIKLQNFGISDLERILYYLCAGIAEEFFFRGLLFFVFENFFVLVLGKRNIWTKGGTIFLTALIFSLSHLQVYGDVPQMMISTFLGGLVLGLGYVLSGNNVFVCIIPHVLNNAFAVGQTYLGYTILAIMMILGVLSARGKKRK